MHCFYCWVDFILMNLFCALTDRHLVDRTKETSTTEAKLFRRATYVTSTSSFVETLLLNKKTMFLLKLQKLPGALKSLLFIV